MLKRIALPGGINRDSTQFAAVDSWYDMNNMRFRGGMPETVGGWGRMTIDVGITEEPKFELEGIGRKCFSARTYPGYLYRYVATNQKLYVISPSKVSDITPNKSESGTANIALHLLAQQPPCTEDKEGHNGRLCTKHNQWSCQKGTTNHMENMINHVILYRL